MAIFSSADITARLSTQAHARLFARNGGTVVDTAFRDLIVAEAESRIRMLTAAAFPAGFDAAGGTVDEALKGAGVDIACGLAASRHPSAGEGGAYVLAMTRAEEFLRKLKADQARPVTSAAGPARPQAGSRNLTDDAGVPTNPFNRAADGRDATGY